MTALWADSGHTKLPLSTSAAYGRQHGDPDRDEPENPNDDRGKGSARQRRFGGEERITVVMNATGQRVELAGVLGHDSWWGRPGRAARTMRRNRRAAA